jgi:hypothetical protein
MTAGGVQHVATGYVTRAFRKLGYTAHQVRVDRFLDEVHRTGGDPVRLSRMFGLRDPTALHYCTDATLLPSNPVTASMAVATAADQ